MPLQGTFDVLSFPDVLTLLASKKGTGRLHARSRSFTANVFFRDGSLVAADQGEHAIASVGDIAGRLEEICFELLEAERGSFEFMPDTLGVVESRLSLEVDDVLERARKRLEEWHEIQAIVPSVDLHPRVVADLKTEEVTLSRELWRLMTAVDGRRSIRAIARTMGISEYEICGMVKTLFEAGVVEFVGPHLSLVAANRGSMVFIDGSLEEMEGETTPGVSPHMVEVGPPLDQLPRAPETPAEPAEAGVAAAQLPIYPAPTGPPAANLPLPPPRIRTAPAPAPASGSSRHGSSRRERSKTVKIGRRRHPSEAPEAIPPMAEAIPPKAEVRPADTTPAEEAPAAASETSAPPPPASNANGNGHHGPECVQ